MKEFLQTLQDAFPILKNHPLAMARILVAMIVLMPLYKAKGARQRICKPLLSKVCDKMHATTRWLFVYHTPNFIDGSKYYTSQSTGKGHLGDDVIWTLVSWPDLKPKDSFRLVGVVGTVGAIHESQAKLQGRWQIVHDPEHIVGPVPALGLRSIFRRLFAKSIKFVGSI